MNREINIKGENNYNLIINNFKLDKFEYLYAKIFIKTDWYQAETNFNFSIDDMKKFSNEIKYIINNKKGKADFFDEDTKVIIKLKIDEYTGKIEITGELQKDLNDEAKIDFFLESDFYNLEQLDYDIDDLIKNYKNY
ncbi:MAG: hypothetical protein GY830_07055 [Bacteroidetes bacterium]|nr:hypothetical protein [Bacteroidota bacterium]